MPLPNWNVQEWSAVVQAGAAIAGLLATLVLLWMTRQSAIQSVEPQMNLQVTPDKTGLLVTNTGGCNLTDLRVQISYSVVNADDEDLPVRELPAPYHCRKLKTGEDWPVAIPSFRNLYERGGGVPESVQAVYVHAEASGFNPVSRKEGVRTLKYALVWERKDGAPIP